LNRPSLHGLGVQSKGNPDSDSGRKGKRFADHTDHLVAPAVEFEPLAQRPLIAETLSRKRLAYDCSIITPPPEY
jgi:hypothetical protein